MRFRVIRVPLGPAGSSAATLVEAQDSDSDNSVIEENTAPYYGRDATYRIPPIPPLGTAASLSGNALPLMVLFWAAHRSGDAYGTCGRRKNLEAGFSLDRLESGV